MKPCRCMTTRCWRKSQRNHKHKPYGLKGWDFCTCDTHMIDVVSKKAERQKQKREIRAELKRIQK